MAQVYNLQARRNLKNFQAPKVYTDVRKLPEFLKPIIVYSCSRHLFRDDGKQTNINNNNNN